jgi:hypothetical protein
MVHYGSSCFFLVLHDYSWFFLFTIVFLSFQWFSTVWLAIFFSLWILTMLPDSWFFVVLPVYPLFCSLWFTLVLRGPSCFFRFFNGFCIVVLFLVFDVFLIHDIHGFPLFGFLHDIVFCGSCCSLWKKIIACSATKIFQLEDYFFCSRNPRYDLSRRDIT